MRAPGKQATAARIFWRMTVLALIYVCSAEHMSLWQVVLGAGIVVFGAYCALLSED